MSVPSRGLLAAAGVLLCVATASRAAADFALETPTDDARYAASWVVDAADNAGRPFAVVDKKGARIYVFEASGRLLGTSPVLLGIAPGDFPVIDPSHRPLGGLAPAERTTPAGRFATEPGHNDKGDDIVWVDYAAALAIHRLRPAPAKQQRAARMASPTADDHRISAGCIIVPAAFYDAAVAPTLGSHRGVVYVLPESSAVQAMFSPTAVASRVR